MNILKVIPALFDVLRKRKSLSNAGTWKNAQAIILLIAAVDTLLKSLGYDFGFTNDDYAIIADFIIYAVSIYLVFATSDKVGLPEKSPPAPPSQGGHVVPYNWTDPTHNRMRNWTGDVLSSDNDSTTVPNDYDNRDGWNG